MINNLSKNQLLYFKKLIQKKYRYEEKKFIIEGKHLIDEAIVRGKNLNCIITSDHHFVSKKIQVFYTTYDNIKQLSTTKTPQEYIGICNFFTKNENLSNSILVLNKINDPGNLGTLIRTAYSFGIKDIIVEGVDIYNSKVLRSSQGAIFDINISNTSNLKQLLLDLKLNQKYKLIGAVLEGAKDYRSIKLSNSKVALILGNEANGIEKEIVEILDYKAYIPIKFESLNVAIAGGILLSKYFGK